MPSRSRHRYYELKDFMARSRSRWNKLYPDFRSHSDGDKLAAYKMVEGVNELYLPKRYKKLHSVWELTSDILRKIEADSFVVKANLGNQGRRVICLHRKKSDGIMMYKDILRHRDYNMNLGQTIAYIINTFKRDEESKGSALFIEEFIGNPERGLPQDYKLYTINGKVRFISIFGRRGRDEYANSYDKFWKPISMSVMYKHPEELDYIENKTPLDGLPKDEMRQKLIELAETLAKKHQAEFCRYDFYCINDKVYFGEITPVCGDLNNYRVLEDFAYSLLPNYHEDSQQDKENKESVKENKKLEHCECTCAYIKESKNKSKKDKKRKENKTEKKDKKDKKGNIF